MVMTYKKDCLLDFLDGTCSKESTCQCRDIKDMGLIPGFSRSLEKEMEFTLVFLPGKFHGHRSLAAYSPRGCKESDMTK